MVYQDPAQSDTIFSVVLVERGWSVINISFVTRIRAHFSSTMSFKSNHQYKIPYTNWRQTTLQIVEDTRLNRANYWTVVSKNLHLSPRIQPSSPPLPSQYISLTYQSIIRGFTAELKTPPLSRGLLIMSPATPSWETTQPRQVMGLRPKQYLSLSDFVLTLVNA